MCHYPVSLRGESHPRELRYSSIRTPLDAPPESLTLALFAPELAVLRESGAELAIHLTAASIQFSLSL
jgi:hypothetical protein